MGDPNPDPNLYLAGAEVERRLADAAVGELGVEGARAVGDEVVGGVLPG